MDVYAYTFTRHRIGESPATVRSPSDTLPVFQAMFAGRETEALGVLVLDAKNHVIGAEVVYVGNVSASLVRVGELFRAAIRLNGSGIILGHNHPSGDPMPSPDDLHLTAQAIAAGDLLDIDVLDHLVVGEVRDGYSTPYVSMRDRGIDFHRKGPSLI